MLFQLKRSFVSLGMRRLSRRECARTLLVAVLVASACVPFAARGDDTTDSAATPEAIRQAAIRGLTILQTGARNYPKHRQCFSCHHQTMPLVAMHEAKRRELVVDSDVYSATLEFSRRTFTQKRSRLLEGKAIEGGALTVGYGLWTFAATESAADEMTRSMVHNLIELQRDDGSWRIQAVRPPAEESLVTCTVLAAYGIKKFADASQADAADAALKKAHRWLETAELKSHEDHVARLWGEWLLVGQSESLDAVRQVVLKTQRDDGGWGQTEDMASDAYATGMTLFVLQESGTVANEPARKRALRFLLRTQKEDGSWHVRTRAKPVQTYFDNGDPHGKDQFISLAATGWSVAALVRSLEKP